MDGQLKVGTILNAESGNQYKVVKMLGAGGQGEVYEVECSGQKYALKWYFKGSATARQKSLLETIIAKGAPDANFLWPLELIIPATGKLFGYVMPLRPQKYCSMYDLMKDRIKPSFNILCKTAFNLTKGYQKLHAVGAKYQDISFGNLFFDPKNGDVLICDNDNVQYDNKKGSIAGTMGFMAPEIMRGEAKPSRNTDLFSLSVLLFHLFMVHHPLEGAQEEKIKCMDLAARIRLYGTNPIFIFDPDNDSNRPNHDYQKNAWSYWPIYPERMRQLFIQAFTIGLHDPARRVTEPEWMTLFANMMNGYVRCSCGAEVFYDETNDATGKKHICWSCNGMVPMPAKLVVGKNRILLNPGTRIPHHVLYNDYDMESYVGTVVQNPKNPALWGIRNEDKENWTYEKPDGTQIPVAIGKAAGIAAGTKIHFKKDIGIFA